MYKLININDFMFLLSISKQDQEFSSCYRYRLSLPGKGQVLVRCSHTRTGLRTLFLFLQFLDLLWNSLVPFTLYSVLNYSFTGFSTPVLLLILLYLQPLLFCSQLARPSPAQQVCALQPCSAVLSLPSSSSSTGEQSPFHRAHR